MTIRIAAVGDPHITEGRRADEVSACLNFVVEDAIAQGAQLFLVAGDIAGTAVPHRASIWERNTFTALVLRMAEAAPVCVITGNHCSPGDWQYLNSLAGRHPIFLREDPDVIELDGVAVFMFPFPHKRKWLAELDHVALEGQDLAVAGRLRELFGEWARKSAAYRAAGVATTMLAHLAIENALVAGGEIMPPGTEITASLGDLDGLGIDMIFDGHIHCRQEVRPNAWIIGTASRSAFNEIDEKGYLLADIAPGQPPLVHPRLTPARKFVTIDVEWAQGEGGQWSWSQDAAPVVTDAEVRIRVTIPEDQAAIAPTDDLVAIATQAGAHAVKLERRARPKQELRCEAITRAQTEEEMLAAYWETAGGPDAAQQARVIAKLTTLRTEVFV